MISLRRWFRPDPDAATAQKLYAAIVAQARHPALYAQGQVPDTLDGRFDMVVLHAALLIRRLRGASDRDRAVAQAVFDAMFLDMDRSLREMGVSDLSVGKRIRTMAESFYGRAQAYDAALTQGGAEGRRALAASLARNVFPDTPAAATASAERLAAYVRAVEASLAAQPAERIREGVVRFPPPELTEPEITR
jgi:cytochrome b pre-mRNA-processing protein 3